MPPRIGVYDSGAGGLTTLALLQAKLPECSWVYFADNARMPFGSKSGDEVAEAAEKAVRRLKREADIVVFGCNTASVTARPQGVFTLIPDLGHSLPSETLVLATPAPSRVLRQRRRVSCAPRRRSSRCLSRYSFPCVSKSRTRLDCSPLFGYLWERLAAFRGRAGKGAARVLALHILRAGDPRPPRRRGLLRRQCGAHGRGERCGARRMAAPPFRSLRAPPFGRRRSAHEICFLGCERTREISLDPLKTSRELRPAFFQYNGLTDVFSAE